MRSSSASGMFILHETLHIDQSMYSSRITAFTCVDRAGEMDYFADAFAMAVSIAWRFG